MGNHDVRGWATIHPKRAETKRWGDGATAIILRGEHIETDGLVTVVAPMSVTVFIRDDEQLDKLADAIEQLRAQRKVHADQLSLHLGVR